MDVIDRGSSRSTYGREQVRALILLAAKARISGVSISNLPDAPALVRELADEADRLGVALTTNGAQRIVAPRGCPRRRSLTSACRCGTAASPATCAWSWRGRRATTSALE